MAVIFSFTGLAEWRAGGLKQVSSRSEAISAVEVGRT